MRHRRVARVREELSECTSSEIEAFSSSSETQDDASTDSPAHVPQQSKSQAGVHSAQRRSARAARTRMQWSSEMHKEFERTVQKLGGPFTATPKAILDKMGAEGLSLTNVKSHLQKYRIKAHKKAKLKAAEAETAAAPARGSSVPLATAAAAAAMARAALAGGSLGRRLPNLSAVLMPNNMVPLSSAGGAGCLSVLPSASNKPMASGMSLLGGAVLEAARLPQAHIAVEDPELAAQAAAWQSKRRELAVALQVALQQQGSGLAGACQLKQFVQLQQENLRCQQVLHTLHIMQMRQHLAAAATLKEHAQLMEGSPAALPMPPELSKQATGTP